MLSTSLSFSSRTCSIEAICAMMPSLVPGADRILAIALSMAELAAKTTDRASAAAGSRPERSK
jgi:hypothetical protein